MSDAIFYFFLVFLLLGAVCLNLYALRFKSLVYPVMIYSGMYFLTVVVGAIFLGLHIRWAWRTLALYDINLSLLPGTFDYAYWFVLFLPFYIPILMAVLFQYTKKIQIYFPFNPRIVTKLIKISVDVLFQRNEKPARLKFSFQMHLLSAAQICFILTFGILCLLVFARLVMVYANIDLSHAKTLSKYASFLFVRKELIDNLGTVLFGFIYRTLPTLSYLALFYACRQRGISWKLIFLASFFIVVVLSVLIAQKGPLMIYLLTLGIGIVVLKKLNLLKIMLMAVSLIMVFIIFQTIILDAGTFLSNLKLLIFRMSSSYPYYLYLYPNIIPFGQMDFGFDIFGLTQKINMTGTVYKYMYQSAAWGGWGDAPSSAHVMAYARGGIPYAVLCSMLLGIFLCLISCLKDYKENAFSFAIFLSALTFFYYATQTSMQDCLVSCYGIVYSFFGIILFLLVYHLIRASFPGGRKTYSQSASS